MQTGRRGSQAIKACRTHSLHHHHAHHASGHLPCLAVVPTKCPKRKYRISQERGWLDITVPGLLDASHMGPSEP